MRIIDADELKEWMTNWLKMDHYYHPDARNDIPINEIEDIISRMPVVDAVPVIRCKDCVYFRRYADGRYDCDNLYGIVDAHKGCFCSRAERRKDNG